MPSRRPPLLSEAGFASIRQRVMQATGVQLADDRRAVVAARLHKRLKALGLPLRPLLPSVFERL